MASKENLIKNTWGSVRTYKRHTQGCSQRHDPKSDECRCAIWIYENRRAWPGEQHPPKPTRRSLNTYSWADAMREAAKVLDGFNPEIAKARAAEEKKKREVMTVHDACQLWLDTTEHEHGKGETWKKYRGLTRKLENWAKQKGIEYIQDVQPIHLEKWYRSADWTSYSDLVRQVWWDTLRVLFKYLHDRKVLTDNPITAIKSVKPRGDHVQGPYTDEQIDAIFAHIDSAGELVPASRREATLQRLHAFITLLLHSGCDVIDAIRFHESQITPMEVGGRTVQVFRYRRTKTGMLAVVPLADDVVKVIRAAPPDKRSPQGMPFRSSPDVQPTSDRAEYSRFIRHVLKAAGVRWVVLPRDRDGRIHRKAANVKQFRHTFAIRMLRAKHSLETVATMLGHKGTAMLKKHYAPFVPELDELHVQSVVARWG